MVITKIIGGLGNQLFQYALGYRLAHERKAKLYLDVNSFKTYTLRQYTLGRFKLHYEVMPKYLLPATTLIRNFPGLSGIFMLPSMVKEDGQWRDLSTIHGSLYLDGYWQNESYFKHYRHDLLKQIQMRQKPSQGFEKLKQLTSKSNAVSIHIRRGDYVTNAKVNTIHGVIPLTYYKKAMTKLGAISNPHYFIFSDDHEWTRGHFGFLKRKTFVFDTLSNETEELLLMSFCQHNLIANSSFSWWGAWLNQNKNKIVIAPKQWFKDPSVNAKGIVPRDWIRI